MEKGQGRRNRPAVVMRVVCRVGVGGGGVGLKRLTGRGELEKSRLHRGRSRKKAAAIGVEGVEMGKYEADGEGMKTRGTRKCGFLLKKGRE